MLKVDVPFGGENAKFGYKDGIFYYLIIFVYSGNVCGYKALLMVHIALITNNQIFYVTGCRTPGIVPCVAHFNCSTGSSCFVFLSLKWLSSMEYTSPGLFHLLLLQYFTPHGYQHQGFKNKGGLQLKTEDLLYMHRSIYGFVRRVIVAAGKPGLLTKTVIFPFFALFRIMPSPSPFQHWRAGLLKDTVSAW